MRVLNLSTTLEPLETLKPHPKNPRRGNTAAIRDSIGHAGFYGTLIAQRSTRRILAGNHRWQAAKQAGLTEIPVTWLDVTDEQARRIMLADNRTADRGTYDEQALLELLQTVHTETNLTGTGYDENDLTAMLDNLNEPTFTPTPAGATRPNRITPAQLAEAADKLTESPPPKHLHPAMCPNCGHEFYVD